MIGSLFPAWLDRTKPLVGAGLLAGTLYVVAVLYYGGSPETWRVGYSPTQPVPFSHALHAGELGMDCRYCHTTVETAALAAIPPSQTCMNCHKQIAPESPQAVGDSRDVRHGGVGAVDSGARFAGLCLLQSQCPCDARCQLRFLSRARRSDGAGLSGQAVEYAVVPGLPSQSGSASAAA